MYAFILCMWFIKVKVSTSARSTMSNRSVQEYLRGHLSTNSIYFPSSQDIDFKESADVCMYVDAITII